MKITMYELLGMIKDSKAPKKIIYDKYVYELNEDRENYEREIDPITTLNWDYIVMNCLNEEVKIIEEEPRDIEVCGSWFTKSEYDKLFRYEEKKIPENNFNYIYSCEDEHIMVNFENIKTTLKDTIEYLKSKGVSLNSAGKSMQIEVYEKEIERLNNIIQEAREIYNNRNTCKLKKQRFMEDKTTADLMYEVLDKGSE